MSEIDWSAPPPGCTVCNCHNCHNCRTHTTCIHPKSGSCTVCNCHNCHNCHNCRTHTTCTHPKSGSCTVCQVPCKMLPSEDAILSLTHGFSTHKDAHNTTPPPPTTTTTHTVLNWLDTIDIYLLDATHVFRGHITWLHIPFSKQDCPHPQARRHSLVDSHIRVHNNHHKLLWELTSVVQCSA